MDSLRSEIKVYYYSNVIGNKLIEVHFDLREERNFTQSLRLEQDEAYRESLKADQEKVHHSTIILS